MSPTILEGSTFCICNDLGDIEAGVDGLYAHDTRFLSRFTLRVAGSRPLLLSSGKVEYFSAAFYSRNAPVDGLDQDVLSRSHDTGSWETASRTTSWSAM